MHRNNSRAEVRARKQAALRRSGSGVHGRKSRRNERRAAKQRLRAGDDG